MDSIDPEDIRGHDGTVRSAMTLWSSRNGPVLYNKWQSLYFLLSRAPYNLEDPDAPMSADGTRKDVQKSISLSYVEVQENLHGPDWRAIPQAEYIAEQRAVRRVQTSGGVSDPASQLTRAVPAAVAKAESRPDG